MFLVFSSPQIMLAHYWKANEVNDVKRRGPKNIKNKAMQTKINLYNKYIIWNITKRYEYSNIVC